MKRNEIDEQFDQELRKRAEREGTPIPEGYAGRVFQTCAGLEESSMKNQQRTKKNAWRWGGAVAAALAVLVAVPNVSPTAAAAMSEIPVLGSLVEIVTFREYSYNDGHNIADVEVPELSGSQAADEINDQVQAYTDQLIAQFQADCEATGEGYQGLDITSSVVTDNDKWFTLRIDATKTQASGYEFSRFYHIDKATGETATLSDLFADDANYVEALSAEVLRQMESRWRRMRARPISRISSRPLTRSRISTGIQMGIWCWCSMSIPSRPDTWECRSLSSPHPSMRDC